ncbi:MAG: T9SS type A sorting domain-containing protein [Methylococcaceae bacterium]|nr:T9SS type A sorting domain-containing protein [Prolixibacteraceae bacterium]
MRLPLLFAVLFSVLFTGAQDKPNFGKCEAMFTYEVNNKIMSIVPATAINFYDHSTGNVNQWFWDFGEGNTSREQNPTFVFTYPLPGSTVKMSPYRTVTLTILTTDSCKSMFSQTINIMGDSIVYPAFCKAQFKYYQSHYDSLANTATIQLNNYSEGDSLQYLWQFDQGKTSTEKEPQVTFDLSQKERKVCLTVTGKNGCTDTFCDAVYLYDPYIPPVDTIIPDPVKCETAFGYSVNYDIKTYAPALVLDFYSKAYPETVKWNWDFGDGTTSREANPTHIFNLPLVRDTLPGDSLIGLPSPFRKVCLTVETVTGCIASYCQDINLYMDTTPVDTFPQACHAWIKYYPASDVVSIPEVVVYKMVDASEGKVISRLWQFEDGTTSTEAEPQVSFSIFKPTQKVALTINTGQCTSTWTEIIYVQGAIRDSVIEEPRPVNIYRMKYESSFPVYMSSCAGWAKAQVYRNDTLVNATNYWWSTGAEGQEVKGLCPTQTYTVKALAPDGTYVSGTFLFNADGTVTDAPFNWWMIGGGDNPLIKCDPANKEYTVEWKLCDGTLVRSDSINLNLINCDSNESNMMIKDASGKVVYSELISSKTLITGYKPVKEGTVKLYPNPVGDVLNIRYSGNRLAEMQVEIWDMAGRQVSVQKFTEVQSGEQLSINVNALNKGLYLCKMISGQKVIRTEKFNK